MKAGRAWAVVAQAALGLLLVTEVVYLVCFFRFLVPLMVQGFEASDTALPNIMLFVLNASLFLSHFGGPCTAIVLVAVAAGWGTFEVVSRSEAKPLIRLAVGGWVALVLAVVALWLSLASASTLAYAARRNRAAPEQPGWPALQAPAPHEAWPDGA